MTCSVRPSVGFIFGDTLLKFLSTNAALLLALTSAKRVSDLSAHSVSSSQCLRIEGNCGFAIFAPFP